jgi:DNA-directed RNA polymerase beta subunit
MRKVRRPELGDKLASRHGQKGVVGMLIPHEHMPFTRDGIVPDIIINPNAFPKRMTVAHLLETVLCKFCCNAGACIDATPFQRCDVNAYCEQLEKVFGIERHGNELLYNGITGQQMESEIFIGPIYYMRLKHMVADKINFRATGGVTALTRQPTKGRSINGGLKIGEMEEHCLRGHGVMSFLKESFMERSDGTTVGLDANGDFTSVTSEEKEHTIMIPHTYKLFTQELNMLCIDAKPCTEPIEEEDHDEYDEDELVYEEDETPEKNEVE